MLGFRGTQSELGEYSISSWEILGKDMLLLKVCEEEPVSHSNSSVDFWVFKFSAADAKNSREDKHCSGKISFLIEDILWLETS